MAMFTFCLFVNIEFKTFGSHIHKSGVVLKKIFVVSIDSSVGRVAVSRKSMLSTSFLFFFNISICILLSFGQ